MEVGPSPALRMMRREVRDLTIQVQAIREEMKICAGEMNLAESREVLYGHETKRLQSRISWFQAYKLPELQDIFHNAVGEIKKDEAQRKIELSTEDLQDAKKREEEMRCLATKFCNERIEAEQKYGRLKAQAADIDSRIVNITFHINKEAEAAYEAARREMEADSEDSEENDEEL